MLRLTELLGRFKGLANTEKAKKELLCAEIAKVIGVQIKPEAVSFSKNTIFLSVEPIIKTEIFLRKSEILEKIKTFPQMSGVADIR